jgi:hypothetical protein
LKIWTGVDSPAADPTGSPFRLVISRATQANPIDRYQDVPEFLQAIEQIAAATRRPVRTSTQGIRELHERLNRSDEPADDALIDLIELSLVPNTPLFVEANEQARHLRGAMLGLTDRTIERLCTIDSDGTRRLFAGFADYVGTHEFPFDTCDPIAGLVERFIRHCGINVGISSGRLPE